MNNEDKGIFTSMSKKDVSNLLIVVDQTLRSEKINNGDLQVIIQFLEEVANTNKNYGYSKADGIGVAGFLGDVVAASSLAILKYGKSAAPAVDIISVISQRKDLDCATAKVILRGSYLLSKRKSFEDKLLPASWVGCVDETIANNPYVSANDKTEYFNDKRCNVHRGVVLQQAKDYAQAKNNIAICSLGNSNTH